MSLIETFSADISLIDSLSTLTPKLFEEF